MALGKTSLISTAILLLCSFSDAFSNNGGFIIFTEPPGTEDHQLMDQNLTVTIDDPIEEPTSEETYLSSLEKKFQQMLAGETDRTGRPIEMSWEEINMVTPPNVPVIEGDIAIEKEQLLDRKMVSNKWPADENSGVVKIYYAVHSNSSDDETVIDEAMDIWDRETCIETEKVAIDSSHYKIVFVKGSGCWSQLGYVGWHPTFAELNYQPISIGQGCNRIGTVLHEIGHALTMLHEQSRPDRDGYVEILEENIYPDRISQFRKEDGSETYGVPYDFTSVMHYGLKAFSQNGEASMLTKPPEYFLLIGQREELSFYDILMMNKHYNCIDTWTADCASPPTCQNDGYVGADCTCQCRRGTSGTNCETEDQGYYDFHPCIDQITTSGEVVQNPVYPGQHDSRQYCAWRAEAPAGQVPQVTITAMKTYHTLTDKDETCNVEYLRIGGEETVWKYKGYKVCNHTDNEVHLACNSDRSVLLYWESRCAPCNTGFTAEVTFVSDSACPTETTTTTTAPATTTTTAPATTTTTAPATTTTTAPATTTTTPAPTTTTAPATTTTTPAPTTTTAPATTTTTPAPTTTTAPATTTTPTTPTYDTCWFEAIEGGLILRPPNIDPQPRGFICNIYVYATVPRAILFELLSMQNFGGKRPDNIWVISHIPDRKGTKTFNSRTPIGTKYATMGGSARIIVKHKSRRAPYDFALKITLMPPSPVQDCEVQKELAAGETYTFDAPKLPQGTTDFTCEWRFITVPGHKLYLTFPAFSLKRADKVIVSLDDQYYIERNSKITKIISGGRGKRMKLTSTGPFISFAAILKKLYTSAPFTAKVTSIPA